MKPILPSHRPVCEFCEREHSRKRGLCWSCYRKFRECQLAMPARRPTGAAVHRNATRQPTEPLARLVAAMRQWPKETRARLLLALQEAEAA